MPTLDDFEQLEARVLALEQVLRRLLRTVELPELEFLDRRRELREVLDMPDQGPPTHRICQAELELLNEVLRR